MAIQERGSFNIFPNEIMLHILSFLSPKDLAITACVCKNFYELAEDTDVRLTSSRIKFKDYKLKQFQVFIQSQPLTTKVLEQAAQYWPSTKVIKLEKKDGQSNGVPTEPILATIAAQFTQLESLILINLTMASDVFKATDADLVKFSKTAYKLKHLKLQDCPNVTSTALTTLLENTQNSLENLTIQSDSINNAVIEQVGKITSLTNLELLGSVSEMDDDKALEVLIDSKLSLKTLNLFLEPSVDSSEPLFSAEKTLELAGSLQNLEYLGLGKAPITDETVSQFVSHSPKLQGLVLDDCRQVTVQSLQTISQCEELVVLQFKSIPDPAEFSARVETLKGEGRIKNNLQAEFTNI